MTQLANLQHQFQQFLLTNDSAIESLIVNTKNISVQQRLAIYGDAYYLRLMEAIDLNYPGLGLLLGDELYEQLARAYIKHYPSSYRSIRWYGEHLSEFISTHFNSIEAQQLVAELAEFEWALRTVFDTENAEVISVEQLATVAPESWPNLCFEFHPSVQAVDCHWNSVQVWQALTNDENIPEFSYQDVPARWLLWRHELQSHFRSLDVHEAWALVTIQKGGNFAELCAGLSEWIDEQHCALQAATLLKQWLSDGMISAVKL